MFLPCTYNKSLRMAVTLIYYANEFTHFPRMVAKQQTGSHNKHCARRVILLAVIVFWLRGIAQGDWNTMSHIRTRYLVKYQLLNITGNESLMMDAVFCFLEKLGQLFCWLTINWSNMFFIYTYSQRQKIVSKCCLSKKCFSLGVCISRSRGSNWMEVE